MGVLDFFRRRRKIPTEAERRAHLLRFGRIAEGTVIDCATLDDGRESAHYLYTINGVDFEASDILTEEQSRDALKYAPGAKVAIRFNPKNHNDAILE